MPEGKDAAAPVDDRDRVCDECGESGRWKARASRGGDVRWFCHDEEKSCYNYRRGTYFDH